MADPVYYKISLDCDHPPTCVSSLQDSSEELKKLSVEVKIDCDL